MTAGELPEDWALPALSPHNEAWFTSGQLALQRCSGCGAVQHPPEEVCRACGGDRFEYPPVRPVGTVHSFTVAHYPVHPALAGSVPYAVVLVSLDDVPEVRVVGNMPGTPLDQIRIGMPVAAVWEERKADDGTVLLMPQWTTRGGP